MKIKSRILLTAALFASCATPALHTPSANAQSANAQSEKLPYIHTYPVNRALTIKDVRDLSPLERAFMRNAIYARHGRPFANAELVKFFARRSWYRKNPNWTQKDEARLLSPMEKQNAAFVASTEGSANDKKNYYLDTSTQIVSGQSVGHVKIGMSRATVNGLLGAPQTIQNRPDKLVQDSWVAQDLQPRWALSTMTVIYRNDKVAQIQVSSIRYLNEGDLSLKNTVGDLRFALKPLRRTLYSFANADGKIAVYDNAAHGLAFTVYIDGEPETDDYNPFSFIVHPVNKAIIPIAREAFGHGFKLSKAQ